MSDSLVDRARGAKSNAYAPYSRFNVGAALQAADGRVFVGANFENASFGVTICAERVALGAAIAAGAREFTRLVVVSDSSPPAAPCGVCRQALREFGGGLHVDAVNEHEKRSWKLDQLLPKAFGPEDLNT